jgi:hypothetical protein
MHVNVFVFVFACYDCVVIGGGVLLVVVIYI